MFSSACGKGFSTLLGLSEVDTSAMIASHFSDCTCDMANIMTKKVSISAVTSAKVISQGGGCSTVSSCSRRSEEHTSELQSLMRISYAVFCLKKKKKN